MLTILVGNGVLYLSGKDMVALHHSLSYLTCAEAGEPWWGSVLELLYSETQDQDNWPAKIVGQGGFYAPLDPHSPADLLKILQDSFVFQPHNVHIYGGGMLLKTREHRVLPLARDFHDVAYFRTTCGVAVLVGKGWMGWSVYGRGVVIPTWSLFGQIENMPGRWTLEVAPTSIASDRNGGPAKSQQANSQPLRR